MYDATMNEDQCPWYKQLWPWLLISLPASAVFGGIATFVLAVNSPNALVADDYYKQGLAINQQTERLRTAAELGLEGLLGRITSSYSSNSRLPICSFPPL